MWPGVPAGPQTWGPRCFSCVLQRPGVESTLPSLLTENERKRKGERIEEVAKLYRL